MNPLRWFYHFIIDRNLKLSHRAAVGVIIIFCVIVIDNQIGLSTYFKTKFSIENLGRVNSIIIDPRTDSVTKAYAIQVRDKIINRRSYLDRLFSRPSFKASSNPTISTPSKIDVISSVPIKNNFWFISSTSGFYIILSAFLFLFFLFKTAPQSLFQRFANGLIFGSGTLFLAYSHYYFLSSMPVLWGNWVYNYIVNFLIQLSTPGLFIVLSKFLERYEEKKTEKKEKEQYEKFKNRFK